LGIDAGTTSTKAGLFDCQGQLLAVHRQEYQLLSPAANIVELPAETYWQACCCVVRHVLEASRVPPEKIAALCISSQGETMVPVDAQGNSLRNAIVWLDGRAVDEAGELVRELGWQRIYQVTGQTDPSPYLPAPKLLWLKRHEPEIWRKAARFLLLEDYLHYRLTGQQVTDGCLQTSSLFYDINTRAWWPEMFNAVGLSPDRFGRLLEPGSPVGPITAQAAAATGLSPHTLAVTGGMDQAVGAVGAGNIRPGIVTETTGGVMAIFATLEQPVLDPQGKVPLYYHAIPGKCGLLPFGQTAGMALKWLRDRFFEHESQDAQAAGRDPYDLLTEMAASVPAGSDGLVVLPHLEGAACPEFNPAARAVFFGAALRHTRAHFVRAVLESVAYMLKRNLDLVEGMGVPVKELRCMGGGARSPLWLQIKADLLQKPVQTLVVEETGLLGAALLAAVAAGAFPDLDQAVQSMVHVGHIIYPQPEMQAVYLAGYSKYVTLYDRLADLF
jgi:xylulokinase